MKLSTVINVVTTLVGLAFAAGMLVFELQDIKENMVTKDQLTITITRERTIYLERMHKEHKELKRELKVGGL